MDNINDERWTDGATGLACVAKIGPMGQWNGYVAVPPDHPFYEVDYSECTEPGCTEKWCIDHTPEGVIEVHGGVTFAGRWKDSDSQWWFGFDTAHAGDLVPGLSTFGGEVFRDLDYVKDECTSMARQLATLASPQPSS